MDLWIKERKDYKMIDANQTGYIKRPVFRPSDMDERLSVAMAYVPWQQFHTVYELDKALECGTIFPELNKPFYGKRGALKC
ncbi:spore coat associated protein CotJA [Lachnospiraceae bacterium ZAX-1]